MEGFNYYYYFYTINCKTEKIANEYKALMQILISNELENKTGKLLKIIIVKYKLLIYFICDDDNSIFFDSLIKDNINCELGNIECFKLCKKN